MTPLSLATARSCRCGEAFPPDRAPQAGYHSDACAAKSSRTRLRIAEAESNEATALRVLDSQPIEAPKPFCDHRGQQPFVDGRSHVCWRCGVRLSEADIEELVEGRDSEFQTLLAECIEQTAA